MFSLRKSCLRIFGENGLEINEFFFSGQLLQVLDMNRLGFVEFWKIIQVFFAQEKEFVIKLLKFLNWVNSSVQATAF